MNDKLQAYQEQLKQLRQNFVNQVPDRFDSIRELWDKILAGEYDDETINEMHIVVHSLAGSGGTFGFKALMNKASSFDNWLKTFVNKGLKFTEEQLSQIQFLINDLCETTLDSKDASVFAATLEKTKGSPKEEARILIIDDDPLASGELQVSLESVAYAVKVVDDWQQLLPAVESFNPHLIIMDMVFPDNDLGGANAIEEMHDKGIDIPVIYVSVRDDMESRLSAIRSGAHHYLTKPIQQEELFALAKTLIDTQPNEAYRVLVVDDDPQLSEFYALMLRNTGMNVTTLNDPMNVLDVIRECKAELIILDIYMPGCNGVETATAIRQIQEFNNIPIIFLSTEHRVDRQLIAMNHGGDDFLVKPVEPNHLVQSVTSRIKRSRVINQTNENLRKTNEALTVAKEDAEIASKAKSDFLSSMSHELRTPLNAILGFAQLLESDANDNDKSEADTELTQQILLAGWHLLELINEVLDMSKIEAGRIDIEPVATSYQTGLIDTLALIESSARARSIEMKELVLDKPPFEVFADPTRLKQILLNLLSNAVKYNKQGGTITISAQEFEEQCSLTITDTGSGLDDKQIDMLFEPFARIHDDGNIEGTGLGLSITRRLVKVMGGSISVESTPGSGSSFSISLPKPSAGSGNNNLATQKTSETTGDDTN